MDEGYGARAFGLTWSSDRPLLDFDRLGRPPQTPDIVVRQGAGAAPIRPGAVAVNRGAICADGVRLEWDREVIFDTYGQGRVEWRPGPDWTGQFPPSLYGTLTAILLAWRGLIPVHASAVEIEGLGYLICGASGAGKSTLAAALIAQGARLISDDLSVLQMDRDAPPVLLRGRPGIRLHPETGERLARALAGDQQIELRPPKVLIRPGQVSPALEGVRLAGIIVRSAGAVERSTIHDLWQRQIFRPRWMSVLPGRRAREAGMLHVARTVPLYPLAPTEINSTYDLAELARHATAVLSNGPTIV